MNNLLLIKEGDKTKIEEICDKANKANVIVAAEEYALYCEDTVEETDENGNINNTIEYGINYGQLHGLEVHTIQKNTNRIQELENEINNLKKRNRRIKSFSIKINIVVGRYTHHYKFTFH